MGLIVTREKSTGGVPIFQQLPENAQGGFVLDTTGLTTGAVVPAGTVMGFDESTRLAKVLKVQRCKPMRPIQMLQASGNRYMRRAV